MDSSLKQLKEIFPNVDSRILWAALLEHGRGEDEVQKVADYLLEEVLSSSDDESLGEIVAPVQRASEPSNSSIMVTEPGDLLEPPGVLATGGDDVVNVDSEISDGSRTSFPEAKDNSLPASFTKLDGGPDIVVDPLGLPVIHDELHPEGNPLSLQESHLSITAPLQDCVPDDSSDLETKRTDEILYPIDIPTSHLQILPLSGPSSARLMLGDEPEDYTCSVPSTDAPILPDSLRVSDAPLQANISDGASVFPNCSDEQELDLERGEEIQVLVSSCETTEITHSIAERTLMERWATIFANPEVDDIERNLEKSTTVKEELQEGLAAVRGLLTEAEEAEKAVACAEGIVDLAGSEIFLRARELRKTAMQSKEEMDSRASKICGNRGMLQEEAEELRARLTRMEEEVRKLEIALAMATSSLKVRVQAAVARKMELDKEAEVKKGQAELEMEAAEKEIEDMARDTAALEVADKKCMELADFLEEGKGKADRLGGQLGLLKEDLDAILYRVNKRCNETPSVKSETGSDSLDSNNAEGVSVSCDMHVLEGNIVLSKDVPKSNVECERLLRGVHLAKAPDHKEKMEEPINMLVPCEHGHEAQPLGLCSDAAGGDRMGMGKDREALEHAKFKATMDNLELQTSGFGSNSQSLIASGSVFSRPAFNFVEPRSENAEDWDLLEYLIEDKAASSGSSSYGAFAGENQQEASGSILVENYVNKSLT